MAAPACAISHHRARTGPLLGPEQAPSRTSSPWAGKATQLPAERSTQHRVLGSSRIEDAAHLRPRMKIFTGRSNGYRPAQGLCTRRARLGRR